jgi:hypothetical protein
MNWILVITCLVGIVLIILHSFLKSLIQHLRAEISRCHTEIDTLKLMLRHAQDFRKRELLDASKPRP